MHVDMLCYVHAWQRGASQFLLNMGSFIMHELQGLAVAAAAAGTSTFLTCSQQSKVKPAIRLQHVQQGLPNSFALYNSTEAFNLQLKQQECYVAVVWMAIDQLMQTAT